MLSSSILRRGEQEAIVFLFWGPFPVAPALQSRSTDNDLLDLGHDKHEKQGERDSYRTVGFRVHKLGGRRAQRPAMGTLGRGMHRHHAGLMSPAGSTANAAATPPRGPGRQLHEQCVGQGSPGKGQLLPDRSRSEDTGKFILCSMNIYFCFSGRGGSTTSSFMPFPLGARFSVLGILPIQLLRII
jgi:hypothetical protein